MDVVNKIKLRIKKARGIGGGSREPWFATIQDIYYEIKDFVFVLGVMLFLLSLIGGALFLFLGIAMLAAKYFGNVFGAIISLLALIIGYGVYSIFARYKENKKNYVSYKNYLDSLRERENSYD